MLRATVVLFPSLQGILLVQASLHSYNEKCDEQKNITTTTADNVTTIEIIKDSCDTQKFLACVNTRCACKDPANQIYSKKDYKVNVVSRSKRGSKKGGKGVSLGKAAVVGAVAGVGAYQLNKGIDHLASSGATYQVSSSSNQKTKKIQKYSCFTRIGGNCAINPDQVRQKQTTTIVNGTSTTTTSTFHYGNEMSECVEDAECKAKSPPSDDPNIGECVCRPGYIRNTVDACTKDKKNGAETAFSGGLGGFFLFGALALAQLM